jgi:hypothetical protein
MTLKLSDDSFCEPGSSMSLWVFLGGKPEEFPKEDQKKIRYERGDQFLNGENLAVLDKCFFGRQDPNLIASEFGMTVDKVLSISGFKDRLRSSTIITAYSTRKFSEDDMLKRYNITYGDLEEIIKYNSLRYVWFKTREAREEKWMKSHAVFRFRPLEI